MRIRLVINGVILLTLPIWLAYLLTVIFGIFCTFAVSAVVLGLVIVVARMADHVDDILQEGPTVAQQTAMGNKALADTSAAGDGVGQAAGATYIYIYIYIYTYMYMYMYMYM